ncbi:hypothetical protein LA303_07005 [Candidatus Sulfidibacterium hydrothermale]|uniref:hypothetical protein n=1 Tax=Candidatus Sulfidibacterium hydrothermale TaxID=2875962 RepID=UPI001F0AEDC4|nr:hypothetical protein [Candidatus Sulfidibacterium hydrothermale]UBM61173.1 hypothetical protein LA303_07005 [Candidatus Sulfidibacterium hydrothermale]
MNKLDRIKKIFLWHHFLTACPRPSGRRRAFRCSPGSTARVRQSPPGAPSSPRFLRLPNRLYCPAPPLQSLTQKTF